MCACLCTHARTHMCVRARARACVRACVCVFVSVFAHTIACVCVHMRARISVSICELVYVHNYTCVLCVDCPQASECVFALSACTCHLRPLPKHTTQQTPTIRSSPSSSALLSDVEAGLETADVSVLSATMLMAPSTQANSMSFALENRRELTRWSRSRTWKTTNGNCCE